ncbi:nucleotide exchange factor GrpE [Lactobacillus iners]|uniref:nucleotide exchange factor GrpE n=1 Tax=Lactobacillus iners TaxID=147802 RepID=UPI001F08B8E4|nr:nucleotide exchange factor GrpE [Lactobacillus iners]MCT7746100.1 nucleotide exchange factor GrpE [Lactobacillus iners]MCT7800892.1 nucleotide exchange factor GrpE [Lactobacillus iners]MCT7803725.1 nucleotide exchange factor GrpE [Lactobacillus iners]
MKEHKDNSVDSKKEKNNTKPKTSSNKEDVSKYTKKIQELELKNQELEDKYLRSEAEIQNAQNRYSKERAQLIKYESQSIAKDILPALDNLERALMVKSDSDVTVQLKKGVQMTLDALIKALNYHGISEIKADGEKFDPKLHQAVQTVDAVKDQEPDHVVQVLQKGYLYKDRTLRPAMVVVTK